MENITENKPGDGIKDNNETESVFPESGDGAFEDAKENNFAQEVINTVNEKVGVTEEELEAVQKEPAENPEIVLYRKRGFRYGSYLFVKRTFDIVTSFLVLLTFSWLY